LYPSIVVTVDSWGSVVDVAWGAITDNAVADVEGSVGMEKFNCGFVGETPDKAGVGKDGALGTIEGETMLATKKTVEVSVIPPASAITPWIRGAESVGVSGRWLPGAGDSG